MGVKSAKQPIGDAIAEVASRQHGVASVAQLYALGLTRRQVERRTQGGSLRRMHRGVYAIGYRPLTRHGHWMAAVLALGKGALLSHRSALALWRIWGEPRGAPVHVTVPSDFGRAARLGVSVHRCAAITPSQITVHHGIPITTPVRTLTDLRPSLPRRSFERAIDEAERLMLATPADLNNLLTDHEPGSTLTRSELEERFLALCTKHGLPRPLVNHALLDCVPDFLWPAFHLIVELDGRAAHGTRLAFQADRDRDTRLAAHGYLTLRFTWFDVTSRPIVVADRVRRALSR